MRAGLPFWIRRHPSMVMALGILATAMALLLPMSLRVKPAPVISSTPPAIPMIMVAARPISTGTVLALQDIHPRPVAGTVPAGTFQSGEAMIGRIATKAFNPGDIPLQSDLRDAASLGIAGRLTAGQRAFSIRVAEDEIVGGFLQSGDHVDVLAVVPGTVFPGKDAGEVADRSQSLLLLQNILVLAVGETLSGGAAVQPTARTISLALQPGQASRLALAQRFGKVALTIRKPGDEGVDAAAPITLSDIVPGVTAKGVPQRRPAAAGIPFLAGTRATTVRAGSAP